MTTHEYDAFFYRSWKYVAIPLFVAATILIVQCIVLVWQVSIYGFPCPSCKEAIRKAQPAIQREAIETKNEPMAMISKQRSRQTRPFSMATNVLYDSEISCCVTRFPEVASSMRSCVLSRLSCLKSYEIPVPARCGLLVIPVLSTLCPKTLTLIQNYADEKEHESEASQAGGCEYLRRAVRRAPADVEGKSGADRGSTCRKERDSQTNAVELGVRYKNSRYRQIAGTSRISWSYSPYSYAPEINFGNFSEKCPLGHISLLTNAPKGIMISPITKNGTVKSDNFLQPLVTNLMNLDQLLALNYSITLYLASDSSQALKHGRKTRTA